MLRGLTALVGAAAVYGFSIGIGHSLLYACRNLAKFPLLILVTALVCALACFICSRLITPALTFAKVQSLMLRMYKDTAVLLASLALVNTFIALTMEQPTSREELGEYPLFQGLNVLFISLCGSLALVRQARRLLRGEGLGGRRATLLLLAWLTLSLAVGAQWAWYLRPFFGIGALGKVDAFCLGTQPDFRGDTNFYEAVYHLLVPPGG